MLRKKDPGLRVYVLGIGGAGLAPLALVLQDLGLQVWGSEIQLSTTTLDLQERGIGIVIGQTSEQLQSLELVQRPHVVLYSSAVAKSNPELRQAVLMGLPTVKRNEFLPALLADRDVLAIAGTHGKSTTTAMLVQILLAAGREPGYILGATSSQFISGQAGTEKLFIIEADEYDGMFLGLDPKGAIVTSVDWDHPDCYPTPEALHSAFNTFLDRIPPDGYVIYNGDSPFLKAWRTARRDTTRSYISYGLAQENDWMVKPTDSDSVEMSTFDIVSRDGSAYSKGRLQTAGIFNQFNATAAWLASCQEGAVPAESICLLRRFRSISRRFENRGSPGGVQLFDDYAHHPAALRLTLDLARAQTQTGTLWAVFQPHTFSRTAALLKSFAGSFSAADRVIILPTFAAREVPSAGVDGRHLHEALIHPAATYCVSQDDAFAFLLKNVQAGDSVVVMGAGDCVKLTDRLLEGFSMLHGNKLSATAPPDATRQLRTK